MIDRKELLRLFEYLYSLEDDPIRPPDKDHRCGDPSSTCDYDCVIWSYHCREMENVRKMIKQLKNGEKIGE
jgi:hypothetical protein